MSHQQSKISKMSQKSLKVAAARLLQLPLLLAGVDYLKQYMEITSHSWTQTCYCYVMHTSEIKFSTPGFGKTGLSVTAFTMFCLYCNNFPTTLLWQKSWQNKGQLTITWHFCLPCTCVPMDVCTAETVGVWAATVSLHPPTLFCLHRLHLLDSCSKGTFHKSMYHCLLSNAIKTVWKIIQWHQLEKNSHQKHKTKILFKWTSSSACNKNICKKETLKFHCNVT